jgi:hypothetical protein
MKPGPALVAKGFLAAVRDHRCRRPADLVLDRVTKDESEK